MKWVDCTKKMPPKYMDVLVHVRYKDGSERFTDSWLDDGGFRMGGATVFTVTHWMQIIPPQRKVKK